MLRWALLIITLSLFTACDFTPKGATVFKVMGDKEYDKAQLAYPESEGERRLPLKLRWADTNTWLTTASLVPAKYIFSARTNEGAFYSKEVELKSGQNRYELAAGGQSSFALTAGPKVSGTVVLPPGRKPPEQVVVVFIGQDVTVRRVPMQNNRFTAEAPIPGNYRVEVHALGNPPLTFASQVLDLKADTDLLKISLK